MLVNSEHHWGAVVTQIPLDQVDRPLADEDHAPSMFLSGAFSGAAIRWAIIEKEAFALVETCKLYFLDAVCGVLVPKYIADKLKQWAILLMAYDFDMTDIAGADNVWADLLSRWVSPLTQLCAIRLVTPPKLPVLDDRFCWSTLGSVVQAQATETLSTDLKLTRADHDIWRTASGACRVPARATDLELLFLIVAHDGSAGPCGSDATFQVIQERFGGKESGMTLYSS
ncbi:unnamed protein product [Phytophthora fragariaefolia]|uniref:Unnamed protein product n=1 Tax=Phytophthora fragariaefolia TaxID=1490495 RepID=A0A9W6XZC7_9STRA|nr:unnamed protein product [Phytophthora fragariaefolia]